MLGLFIKTELFIISGMSYYCDFSVVIYFTGFSDNPLTVSKFKNEYGTISMSFLQEEIVSMNSNRRPFSLQHLIVLVDIWLKCRLEPKLNRSAITVALIEVRLLSCWEKLCSSAMATCDHGYSSQRLLLT